MTKREWLEEYLKEPSNYISLKQAAQYCDYSQDYLSLRARQRKLKAVKFGKNWLTRREWLKDYLAENRKHIKQLEEFQITEEPKALEEPTPSTLIPLITKMLRTGVLSVLILTLLVSGATAGRNLFFENFLPHVIKVHEISGKFINNLVLPIIESSPALKSVVLNIAAVQETASDIFEDYFSWLGNSFGSISSKLIKTYLVIHDSFDEGTKQGLEVMKDFFSYLSSGIKGFFSYFPEVIKNFFSRGEIPRDGLLTEQAFIETEERLTEKLIQAFQQGFEKLQKEGIPSKEIIREIRIEPIKEITKVKEITKEVITIDSAALVQLRSDMQYVQAELANRLLTPGGAITQQIYVRGPIQSLKLYRDNDDILLYTLGSGNIVLSAATALQLSGGQVIIDSTSVSNPLIYLADETRIDGPLTAQRITLNAPSGYVGKVLDVQSDGDSKFSVESTGNATLIGDFTITGALSVTGNQTLNGIVSLTASSTSPVLTVTQEGLGYGAIITGGYVGIATSTPSAQLAVAGDILGSGNIILTGTAASTFAGPLQITTITQPQLVVRYDSTNYLTASVSSTGLTSLVSTGGLNLTGAGSSVWQTTNYGSLTIQSASSTEIVSGDTLTASSTAEMIFATAGQERIRLDTSGRLGIATTTPSYELHVWGSAGFGTSTIPTLFVDSGTGRVGIGKTAPESKLHVYSSGDTGDIRVEDAYPQLLLQTTNDANYGALSFVNTSDATRGYVLYDFNSDFMAFRTAGTEQVRIDNQGNVGIGTTGPTSLLELYKLGSTGSNPVLTITNASTTADIDPTLAFRKASTDEWKIYMDDSDSDKLKIATTTADVLTIDQSGNVGIGTTNPSNPLEVIGNANAIRFGDQDNVANTGILVAGSTFYGFRDGDGADTLTILQSNGNVGIATTTPSYKLHVWGSAGFGTSTTPTLFVDSGTGRVGIASSTPIEALTVQGNIFGTGSLTISGHLMPTDPRTQDIGSDDYDWRDLYVNSVYANNINAASSTIAGTSAGTFTINSDATADATSSLRFYRGTESPHALLAWDAGYDRFNLNFPLYLSVTGDITASDALTLYSGNGLDITLDSAGKIILSDNTDINANLDVSGSLTIGSGADQFYIDSSGNATTTGVFYAAAFRSDSDDATIRKSGDQIVRGVVPIFGFDLPARTASSSYTQVSRYIENDAFPSAYSGTVRKYKFAIRYADATTTIASMWQIATSTDASSFTFTVPFSDTTDLAKGNAYITDTTSLPALPWRLDVKTGGSGGYSIQVYDIVLIAVDEVN